MWNAWPQRNVQLLVDLVIVLHIIGIDGAFNLIYLLNS